MAAGATAPTSAKADKVLTIECVETDDRLDPDPKTGIIARHEIEATLTADNHVGEHDENRAGGRQRVFFKQLESRGALGDISAWATWRVLRPHTGDPARISPPKVLSAQCSIR